eukprot:gnl/MRDRNA2_/MRDRNA2_30896_c0_seq1.p1 gnl/MRDRNA2_/MRDRNA2_30896_c0~~gnl/MRDRNA2_/MRDRNA2_30896_c0_seq1.p1  ORF type:complete len:229 (+),score=42.61 gnl/MRDRNA2_/MRDRNA2_30896_c0_seq1:88-774(+)
MSVLPARTVSRPAFQRRLKRPSATELLDLDADGELGPQGNTAEVSMSHSCSVSEPKSTQSNSSCSGSSSGNASRTANRSFAARRALAAKENAAASSLEPQQSGTGSSTSSQNTKADAKSIQGGRQVNDRNVMRKVAHEESDARLSAAAAFTFGVICQAAQDPPVVTSQSLTEALSRFGVTLQTPEETEEALLAFAAKRTGSTSPLDLEAFKRLFASLGFKAEKGGRVW